MKLKSFLIIFLTFLSTSIYSFESSEEEEIEEKENLNSIEPPEFSLESGFYDIEEVKELKIKSNNTIYYTLDSTDPIVSETAKIYSKPIKMYDRSSDPNVYSKYQSETKSPYSIFINGNFKVGSLLFDKITVVRAVCQNDEGQFSQVVTKSYFVMDSEKLEFYKGIPAVSLVTNPENLFDKDTGIYVVGQKYVDYINGNDPDRQISRTLANFNQKGKDWEREASFTFFKKGGKFGFTQNLGIRIKGASTTHHKNKSFNIYARKKYGESKVKFELLKDNKCFVDNKIINKYDSFSLRGIDWVERMREKILQSPLKNIGNLATYDADRCMVFIDGELWGLYDIMERCSAYYISTNYKIPEDDISIIKNGDVESGPDKEKDNLHKLNDFCKNNSLIDEKNYKYVIDKIDIDSMILHYSTGFYLGIWDWPNHNYLLWRNLGKKIKDNVYSDGKWRFGIFDFDFSAGLTYGKYGGKEGYEFNYFLKFIDEEKPQGFPSAMFVALLKNEKFRQKFIDTYYSFAEDVYEKKKMSELIDEFEEKYVKYHTLSAWRWRSNDTDSTFEAFANWENGNLAKELNKMRVFFNNRANYTFDQLDKYLNNSIINADVDDNKDNDEKEDDE